MTAYVILDVDIKDAATYAEYVAIAPAAVALYGGRYIARGGKTELLEGNWQPKRLVILEFASLERAKAWVESPEYRLARSIRHKAAVTNVVVVEGV